MAENISSAAVPFSLPWWDDGYQALLDWLLFQLRQLWGRGWKRDLLGRLSGASYSTSSSRTVAIKHHQCSYRSRLLKREGSGNMSPDLLQICFIGHPSAVSLRFPAGPPATVELPWWDFIPHPPFPVLHCSCGLSKKPSLCFWLHTRCFSQHTLLLVGSSPCSGQQMVKSDKDWLTAWEKERESVGGCQRNVTRWTMSGIALIKQHFV